MKNKLGVHALVWVGGWSQDECTRAIAQTAELGFDLIEAPALDPKSIDIAFTQKQLKKNGIGITLSLGLDAETDISSGDREKMRRGEARLLDALSVARDLGATHMCGILYSAFQKYSEPPTAAGIAGAVDVLGRVCDVAGKSGITIGIEVVNRYESNVINTAAQAVDLCKRIGAPNAKVHLDCYHMNIEEADVEQAIIETGPLLGYFHTGDSHRGYLGTGSVNFEKVFRGLARIGYEGPITFESFTSTVTGQPLTGILGIWRDLWTDGRDLCRHAKAFTEAHLKSASEVNALAGSRLP